MCDLCEIVKKVVRGEEIKEEVLFKDGICVAIKGATTKLPIFIRRPHESNPLPPFKNDMKETARRLFPNMEIDEESSRGAGHYFFYMRPKKEKKG